MSPAVALTPVDRELLNRLLGKKPGAWNDFVDRFLSLIYHTIHYTAHLRSARVTPEDVEDIAAEVMLQFVADDYKAVKQFQGRASLATYVTVIARRTAVHEIGRRQSVKDAIRRGDSKLHEVLEAADEATARSLERLEEVERLLRRLPGSKEREIVRQYYLEGRSYEEISTETGVPVNTIGSVLSRARAKLREYRKSGTEFPAVKPSNGAAKSRKPKKPK